ncbi:apolipoprotein Eb-like [Pagrus major]|uniref:apolipoprotein Eb-like n=1 Tax=Pagrus major TaxID=143350 RepID=UPI003CC87A26
MKAVALILALAVITGSSARAVPQAEDTAHEVWMAIMDQAHGYFSKLDQKADGLVQKLNVCPQCASQISRELDALISDTIQTKLMPYDGNSPGDFTQDLELVIKKYMQGHQLDTQAKEIRTQLEATNQELFELLSSLATKIREKIKSIVDEVEESSTA